MCGRMFSIQALESVFFHFRFLRNWFSYSVPFSFPILQIKHCLVWLTSCKPEKESWALGKVSAFQGLQSSLPISGLESCSFSYTLDVTAFEALLRLYSSPLFGIDMLSEVSSCIAYYFTEPDRQWSNSLVILFHIKLFELSNSHGRVLVAENIVDTMVFDLCFFVCEDDLYLGRPFGSCCSLLW